MSYKRSTLFEVLGSPQYAPSCCQDPLGWCAPMDPCLEIGHPVLVQQHLKRDDLAFFKRLLGEGHDINALDFVQRSKKHAVDKMRSFRSSGTN